jgi:hypothetical protein
MKARTQNMTLLTTRNGVTSELRLPRPWSTVKTVGLTALLLGVLCPKSALAQDAETEEAKADAPTEAVAADDILSMDPASPSGTPLAGGTTPSFGSKSIGEGDWRFDFHGFMTVPMVMGVGEREDPAPGQSKTTLHSPPVIPGDKETFSHTGVTPTQYVQLNFSYGNSLITANVQLLAQQTSVSMGFFDPPSQAGINDAYFTITPDLGSPKVDLKMHFGAFSNRYGLPGEFDEGRYGTPLAFRTNGVGENIVAKMRVGKDTVLALEQGFQGQGNKAPSDLTPDLWNGFADPNAGSSFVSHVHAGVNFKKTVSLGVHYASAFSRDDRATGTLLPDGSINILGADLRLTMGRFGHFFLAGTRVDAKYATTVSRLIEVLNAEGGAGLVENYFGDQSNGNGALNILGAQYDLSLGRLVSYPVPFYGDGPDIVVSAYGMGVNVESDDDRADKTNKVKFGAEATYSLLSWLAASARFDDVMPNLNETRYSYLVVSPRVIFRTDWQATDQLVLQYSRFMHGSLTTTRTGAPPTVDPFVKPDNHVISLSASMWW